MNAVQYSREVKEVVNITLDNENHFDKSIMLSEFGAFGYEVRVKGNAKTYQDREVNTFDTVLKSFELEIENVYEDGDLLNLNNSELALIEENLKKGIELNFN